MERFLVVLATFLAAPALDARARERRAEHTLCARYSSQKHVNSLNSFVTVRGRSSSRRSEWEVKTRPPSNENTIKIRKATARGKLKVKKKKLNIIGKTTLLLTT